jgi:hypothetical protein
MSENAPVLSAATRTVALVVGVDDLSALAAAQGVDPAALSLSGASRDAWALARVLNRLGVGEITVLSNTPQPEGWTVQGTWAGAPEAAALRSAVEDFAAELAKDADARGIFVYCGSGGVREDGLVLLASDTAELGDDAQVLTLAALRATLDDQICGRGILAVLDCAFDPAASVFPRARLRSAPLPANTTERSLLRAEDLVFAAAAPYRPAFERELGLDWRGVWSRALETVLDQVADRPEADQKALCWADVARAALALVEDAGHGQRPVVWGSTALQAAPVRVDASVAVAGSVVIQDQVDPGVIFIIMRPNTDEPIGRIEVRERLTGPVERVVWHDSTPAWPDSFDLVQLAPQANVPDNANWPPGETTVEVHPYRSFALGGELSSEVADPRGGTLLASYSVRFLPGAGADLPYAYVRVEDLAPGPAVPGATLPNGKLRVMDWFRHLRATVGASADGMVVDLTQARWEFRSAAEPLGQGISDYVYAPLSD